MNNETASNSPKTKKDILMIAAYVLFACASAASLYLLAALPSFEIIEMTDTAQKALIDAILGLVLMAAFAVPACILYFRLTILGIYISKFWKNYLWVFTLVHIAHCIMFIPNMISVPLHQYADVFFNIEAGANLFLVVLSIVFLRHDNFDNRLIRFFSSKWFVIVLLTFMVFQFIPNIGEYFQRYMGTASNEAVQNAWAEKLDVTLYAPRVPFFRLIGLAGYIASLIIFVVSSISEKKLGKVLQIVILCTIALFAVCFIIDYIGFIGSMESDESFVSLFYYWDYYSMVRIVLFAAVLRMLPKEPFKKVTA